MLPNVICPGFQKAGTTYLFSLLRQHPEIFMPQSKELHYFSNPKLRQKGVAYYESFFNKHTDEPVVMEVTPRYITAESFVIDMKQILGGKVKFIVMVRDPMKRLISHYRMRRAKFKGRLTLTEVIKRGLEDRSDSYLDYVKRGIYSEQLKFIEKHYSREQLHLVTLKQLIKEPHHQLKKILQFLQIEQEFIFDLDKPKNPSKDSYVNLLGRLYYYIPRRYHQMFLDFLPEDFENVYEKYLFNKNNTQPQEIIAPEVLSKLLPIYKKQKEILTTDYGLNLDDWLIDYE